MKRLTTFMVGIAVGTVLGISLPGCTSKISEEQLAKIQELKRKEAALHEQIQSKKSDILQLRTEISKRQRTVDDCQKRLEFVKSKLAQWPNVWPEVRPLVPQQKQ